MSSFEYLEDAHISWDDLSFEAYNRGKDVAGFESIDQGLNEFLHNQDEVAQFQEDGLGKTTLVYCHGCLVGYFTVAVNALELRYVDAKKLAKAFKKRQKEVIDNIPALLIGRFAVDRRVARKGIGRFMMRYIVGLAQQLNSDSVAVRLIILQALPDAQKFYIKQGFLYTEEVKRERGRDNRTMYFDLEWLREKE